MLDLRYVAATSGSSDDDPDDGYDRFDVDVELTWQVRGFDDVPSSVNVPVVMRDDGSSTWFVTARETPADRAPIWFNDAVEVRRPSPDLLVVRSRQLPHTDRPGRCRRGAHGARRSPALGR